MSGDRRMLFFYFARAQHQRNGEGDCCTTASRPPSRVGRSFRVRVYRGWGSRRNPRPEGIWGMLGAVRLVGGLGAPMTRVHFKAHSLINLQLQPLKPQTLNTPNCQSAQTLSSNTLMPSEGVSWPTRAEGYLRPKP